MGADKLFQNTPNTYPKMYLPNLSAQAQKFEISMKKGFDQTLLFCRWKENVKLVNYDLIFFLLKRENVLKIDRK